MASKPVMKRESGVNPEQTRCCKLRLRAEHITFCHWTYCSGRRSDTGV